MHKHRKCSKPVRWLFGQSLQGISAAMWTLNPMDNHLLTG